MDKQQEQKINEYVDKYAKKHHITVEEAKTHLMCSYYAEHVVNHIRIGQDDKI